jgi:type I restriction enzyme, S subunit
MRTLKIKEVFHSIKNGANIKQDKSSGGIPITRIETIVDCKFDFERLGYSGIHDDSFSGYYLKEGDILMSHINSVSHLGKVAIFENRHVKVIHGMNLLCLKANRKIIFPKYAYYFFRTPIFINSIKKITKKSVNQASINISNLENVNISVPKNLEDQIKIATVLSKVESLIQQRQTSIHLLDEFVNSTFFKMFGNPIINEKKFKTILLGEIVEDFKYGTNTISGEKSAKRNFPILRIPNIIDGTINYNGLKFSEINEIEKEKIKVKKGDILFVRTNGNPAHIARCAVFNDDFECGYASYLIRARLKPKSIVSPNFVKDTLSFPSFRKLLLSKSTTTAGNYNINTDSLKSLLIFVPPIKLQNKYAQIVKRVDILKEQYKSSSIELENLFGSFSQKAFKGELDLSALVLEQEVIQIQEQENNINTVLNPQMLAFIKKTSELQNTFALLPKIPALPNGLDKISKQIEQINKLIKPFEKIPRIPQEVVNAIETYENIKSISLKLQEQKKTKDDKIKWGGVSTEEIANWIKEEFNGYYFNRDMIFRLLLEEHVTFPLYYSSEELKTNPRLDEADDLKSFIFSAINNENPFIKIEQVFYNGEKENFKLKITKEDNRYYKSLDVKEKSGIYFKIIE